MDNRNNPANLMQPQTTDSAGNNFFSVNVNMNLNLNLCMSDGENQLQNTTSNASSNE